MKISVVVPFFNSSSTLGECVHAISQANPQPEEVILVNDGSTDDSAEVIKKYPFIFLNHENNLGRGAARNAGAAAAKGDIIVFIDSDVIVEQSVFGRLRDIFENSPNITGISCVPSPFNPYANFASVYKAIYMHHVLSSFEGPVDFAQGCLQAYRKRIVFEEAKIYFSDIPRAEDVELGLRVTALGYKLILTREIHISHFRYFNVLSLLKNDFLVPFHFARLMVEYRRIGRSLIEFHFAHASLCQVAALMTAFSLLACLPLAAVSPHIAAIVASFLVLTNTALNWKFLKVLQNHGGSRLAFKAFFFNIVDQIVMAAGTIAGVLTSLIFHTSHRA